MRTILYSLAIIFFVAWAVSFFGYHIGGIIHVLLVIALFALIMRIIEGTRPM